MQHGAAAFGVEDGTVLWTFAITDVLIGLSYIVISAALVYLVWRGRREFPFQTMFLAFGLFIIACGATHLVSVVTLWTPAPWVGAGINIVTAGASVGTAILFPPLIPRILHTIREAKLSGERLREAEHVRSELATVERFRASVEGAGVGVGHLDAQRRWIWVNPRLSEITGYSAADLRGMPLSDLFHPDERDSLGGMGNGRSTELRMLRRDGVERWLDFSVSEVTDPGGPERYYIAIAQDVTLRREAEEALRSAKEAADDANKAKSEFLSTMSHELRTPLNAIGGYVELISSEIHGPVTDPQQASLERIRTNQAHLLALINDILNYARLEAGHLEVRTEVLSVDQLVREMAELVEPQLQAANLGYSGTRPGPNLRVLGDPDRIRQILLNLLGNAIKFTPEGGRIEVSTSETPETASIHVRDTGCGIDPEIISKVFDPFFQVRHEHQRDPSRQGVGLGLSISRDLAVAMGGEIQVDSKLRVGSTFTLVLPRAEAAAIVGSGGDTRS